MTKRHDLEVRGLTDFSQCIPSIHCSLTPGVLTIWPCNASGSIMGELGKGSNLYSTWLQSALAKASPLRVMDIFI